MAILDTSTWTRLIRNATLATCAEGRPYGLIPKGAVALAGNRIAWVGSKRDVPATLPKTCAVNEVNYALVTPGLIDCHTHLVWAGSRYKEFEQRLQGASYEDIARAGGGIANTVTATRAASEADLLTGALARAGKYVAEGVTTMEVKSGYGLDKDNELKILRVARTLGKRLSINVRTTLLAAHALPPEYNGRPDDYIQYVCDEILPAAVAEGLADAVDAYCDTVGFTAAQVERVFVKAKELGLGVKLHAEQFSNQQGAALAAKYKALSADHLEHLDKDGVLAMAASRTVAVLLPGCVHLPARDEAPAHRAAAREPRADRHRERPEPRQFSARLAPAQHDARLHAVRPHDRGGAARRDTQRRARIGPAQGARQHRARQDRRHRHLERRASRRARRAVRPASPGRRAARRRRRLITLDQLKRRGTGFLPGYMGIVITGLDGKELRAELTVQRHHIAPNGYLHAGTVVTLADTVSGYGCIANLPEGANGFTTIELKSNFLGTAREGTIDCVASAAHLGRTTQLWDAVVTHRETGKTIALFRCTQLVIYPKS